MDATDKTKKRFTRVIGLLGVSSWFLWGALAIYLKTCAPSFPDPSTGRIYLGFARTKVTYLTWTEHFLMYFLLGVALFMLFSFAVIDLYAWKYIAKIINGRVKNKEVDDQ